MTERLKYHFEPKKGWINDPNGLVYFKGKYHAFFQHYPYAPKWGQMHWGHAISDDLVHWEELPIALYPDQSYENSDGCFSGSAIVKDDMLFLFYTSVSHEHGQTQSLAISKDGLTFAKYEGNPIIQQYPADGSEEFRDPKVTKMDDTYYMVCGSGKDGCGKVLLYRSYDLFNWEYTGVLFEGEQYGTVLECPDFSKFGDKYVLMFSQMGKKTYSTMFVYGDFDGKSFSPISFHTPEAGPHFYAPQTFLDDKGRRIVIGWLYSWDKKAEEGVDFAGALSIPREITMRHGKICTYPVAEAQGLLSGMESADTAKKYISALCKENNIVLQVPREDMESIAFLKDTKTVEVFINNGACSFSLWLTK